MSDIIMSIQELIDTAFQDENISRSANNTINFRLLKTAIIILANQLRVLNRHVQVNVDNWRFKNSLHPSQVVSEIRLQFNDENEQQIKEGRKEGSTKKVSRKTKQHEPRAEDDRSKESKIKEDGKRTTKEKSHKKDVDKEKDDYKEKKLSGQSSKTILNYRSPYEEAKDLQEELPVLHKGASISLRKTNEDELEELREREIRTITQRADSHEDPALSPSPMASVHSFGKENLLIVTPQGRAPRISVVTKDQFDELANIVHELQTRFDPIGIPNFPENAEFLKALRSGASLTEAMAAFQLSARLQTFEKAFGIMLSLLTDLAIKTPGADVTQFQEFENNFARRNLPNEIKVAPRNEQVKTDGVSREEFNNAMHEMNDKIIEMVNNTNKPSGTDTKNTKILLSDLERKIESLNYRERIENLEAELTDYAEKFFNLDFSLSSQIGSYQEQLTQMQYQLETGIENMVDKVSHIRTAPEALMELNLRQDALQQDLENVALEQRGLREFQKDITHDLARLWKDIEMLRDSKADRDEIVDALRDKAGIEGLNGMVSMEQFDAVCGGLEAKIKASYDKFSDQERVWQNALDDLSRSINGKCDWNQLCALRDDISHHLNNLQDKVNTLIEVVGEPRAAAIRKKLFSDTDCICCGTPAGMNTEVHAQRKQSIKRPSADGAENPSLPKEDGDGDHTGACMPGRRVPRLEDSRNHVCHRFCGGSHTMIPPLARAPHGVTITQLPREVTTIIGSDGKAYQTDEIIASVPCGPCNIQKPDPQTQKTTEDHASRKPPEAENTNEGRSSSFDILNEISWLVAKHEDSESQVFRSVKDE